jgi:hypothetical protein
MLIGPGPPGLQAPAGSQNHLQYELFWASPLHKQAILFLPARRTRVTIGPNDLAPIQLDGRRDLRAGMVGPDTGRLRA